MKNKIFLKIGATFILIISVYLLFITFIISPKITKYLLDFEKTQVKLQLEKISYIVDSKKEQISEFETFKDKEYRQRIRNLSYFAYDIFEDYYKDFENNNYSKEEALKKAISIISKISYDDEAYLYIIDLKGTILFHPDKSNIGKNFYNAKDAKGRVFAPTIITNVIQEKETYSNYSWKKLNSDIVSDKIVHSIYFEPFDIIISSVTAKSNIQMEIDAQKEKAVQNLTPLIDTLFKEGYGDIFILDEEFRVIAHPNKSLIGDSLALGKYGKYLNVPKLSRELKEASLSKNVWKYTWNTEEDPENFSYEKLGWVEYNDFFGWYIISSIYKKDLEKKVEEIDSMLINLSIILLFIVVFIAIVFLQKLLKPIQDLSENARLVEEGNLEVRTPVQSNDELGILANHFNKMLDSIQENTKNLEEKIEERTEELRKKLYYDDLTGLENRECLIDSIKDEEFVAINFIDINNFDDINELYGFQIGNELLIKITERLKEFAKEHDLTLYRVNGDIFALKDTSIVRFLAYEKMIDKIHELFVKEFKIEGLGVDLYLSVTVGTSISQNQPVKCANTALNKAKQTSQRTVVYNKNIDVKENIKKMMHWKDKIKNAIINDNVIPFFQPIFDKDENLIKYETLMRIKDTVDGEEKFLAPGNFFDVAIKTKQYFKLNQIIIKKAFDNLDRIGKLVSVNISFSDILNLDFMDFIEREVNLLTKEQREKVVFEILESDFISDHKVLDDFIGTFRKKGIKFAIDDFGTGYSNFTHVLNIKPEYIKIDGSLIKNIDTDQTSYEMVKSIIDFCKSLKIIVVVEFIHNETVYKILQKLDADEYQGFYLGEPAPLF
ncbi:MAG: EAL domain-containing protein [Campylobacteraceae bacterium]|nr:EAL domain-containing protein [Campylobacteraceae bacterium]